MSKNERPKAEAIQIMRRAASEIEKLRRIHNELAPKAEAYDALVAVIRMLPGPSVTSSEDIAWLLRSRIEDLRDPEPVEASTE